MPQTALFSVENLDQSDALNHDIWSQSPSVQASIQPVASLMAPGAIGAQQGLCGTPPLPWVPDLVGRDWRNPEAVLVVGSAYAGFVREYSTRDCTLSLNEYRHARTWQDFQAAFVRQVVLPDGRYYAPVATLCADAPPCGFAVFDLCRVSFVRRGAGQGSRVDASGDRVVRDGAAVYERYVESPQPSEWLWRRLTEGQAVRILALGSIAEHGILRLFARKGMTVRPHGGFDSSACRLAATTGGGWVTRYAAPGRTLEGWLNDACWWDVSGTVAGAFRRWGVLPTLHPSRRPRDPRYTRTLDLLRLMRVFAVADER